MNEDIKENVSQPERELSDKEIKKLEKEAAKARKNEVKHILLGNFTLSSGGALSAGSGRWITPFGVGDGAGNTIVYGMTEKTFYYKTSLKNNQQAVYRVTKAMADIGRRLSLETAPDAAVCYIKSLVFRPVVLIFEEYGNDDNGGLKLSAYCSRSPLSFAAIFRALSRFESVLPEEIERGIG